MNFFRRAAWLVLVAGLLPPAVARCQGYIPMPADSATWRYRGYDADFGVRVTDFILYLSGADTVADGHTYRVIMSRTCIQAGPPGFNPPIAPVDATSGDVYFGAIRESGRQVFQLQRAGEQMIFDFTVAVGDSIPAYSGKVAVTAIDSIMLDDGLYHVRFSTTDTNYSAIEGVGSTEGLIPDLNDGLGDLLFLCLTHNPLQYVPDTAYPCTPVYPLGYSEFVRPVIQAVTKVYPNPCSDVLTIEAGSPSPTTITSSLGQIMWRGTVTGVAAVPVRQWPAGVYVLRDGKGTTMKIAVQ